MKKWRWIWVVVALALVGCLGILAMVLGLVFWLPSLLLSDQPVQLGAGAGEDPTPIREAFVQSLRETGEGRITAQQLNAIFPQSDDVQCAFDLLEDQLEIQCSLMLEPGDDSDDSWLNISWRGRLEVRDGTCTMMEHDRVRMGRIPFTRSVSVFGVEQCQEALDNPDNADFLANVEAFYVEDSVLVIGVSEAGRGALRGPQDMRGANPADDSGSD